MALPPLAAARSSSPDPAMLQSRPTSVSATASHRATGVSSSAELPNMPSPSVTGGHTVRILGLASGTASPVPGTAHTGRNTAVSTSPTGLMGTSPLTGSLGSPSRSRHRSTKPRIDTGPHKISQAQRAEKLHTQLMELLRNEWSSIRGTNLGTAAAAALHL
jgi:hypothetical protein